MSDAAPNPSFHPEREFVAVPASLRFDIFCRVIDNFGDVGVCWRLGRDLAARGQRVRLWADDVSALTWMAPEGCAGVEVRKWTESLDLRGVTVGDVLIEAFGCHVPDEFVTMFSVAAQDQYTSASGTFHAWINLEYLTAELFARRSHGLRSPVQCGPGAGLIKHFFYPGFTPGTGGLIRETDLAERQARFDRAAWLATHGIGADGEKLISLFCYEPDALEPLLDQLARDPAPTRLLVTAGRAQAAVQALMAGSTRRGSLALMYLPRLSQRDFDHLLWASDLNFVRGEDSLVRALWGRRPFVWQIYPQSDGAHEAKLDAFLDWLAPPESVAHFHRAWNGLAGGGLPALPGPYLPGWADAVQAARERLLAQDDLTTRLLGFIAGKG